MKININDPRLTAYILNELNSDDRAFIESAIQEDPALKIELALLQKNIMLLQKNELQDLDFKLTAKQRSEIFSQIAKKQKTFTPWHYELTGGGLVAAGLAVLVFTHSLKEDVQVYDTAPIQAQIAAPAKEEAPSEGIAAKKVEMKLEKSKSEDDEDAAAASEAPASQAAAVSDVAAPAKMAARSVIKTDANNFLPEKNSIQLIAVKPQIDPKLYIQLEKLVDRCFAIDIKNDLGVIEFSWLSPSQKLEVTPSRTSHLVSNATKACLQSTFVNITWPRSGLFVFKLQTVSKLNIEK